MDVIEWLKSEYPKRCKTKLDLGKSFVRFKNPQKIPLDLIAQQLRKMNPDEWLKLYESRLKKLKRVSF